MRLQPRALALQGPRSKGQRGFGLFQAGQHAIGHGATQVLSALVSAMTRGAHLATGGA